MPDVSAPDTAVSSTPPPSSPADPEPATGPGTVADRPALVDLGSGAAPVCSDGMCEL